MSEEQLRCWAIEQVVLHHKGSGMVVDSVIAEAKKLIEFVKPSDAKVKVA